MVDNGYLSWSCTVPSIKNGATYKQIRFAEWLESMRKDVECTFGIMKGRFSVLRYGTRLHSMKKCDQIFLTCCALHNRLLFVDCLHQNWISGAESDWEKEYHNNNSKTSFAIHRLYRAHQQNEVNIRNESDTLFYFIFILPYTKRILYTIIPRKMGIPFITYVIKN